MDGRTDRQTDGQNPINPELCFLGYKYWFISTPTFVGRGHSSNSRSMTAGPKGSSIGICTMSPTTTSSQPNSVSPICCSINIA